MSVICFGLAGLYLVTSCPKLADPMNVLSLAEIAAEDVKSSDLNGWVWLLIVYWHFCCFLSLFFIARWPWRQYSDRRPLFFTDYEMEVLDLNDDSPDLLQGLPTQLAMAIVPGNQLLSLSVDSKVFTFEHLPKAFDGYKIIHLSDLHYTGRIGKAFFVRVVELCNQWQPDMVCITGDLIDKKKCLPWIEDTFGQLRANDGVFYILGNHDRRIKDEKGLRAGLASAGLVDVNGRYVSVDRDSEGGLARLVLAGNELPWFPGAEKLKSTVEQEVDRAKEFYISLCHSPDQHVWAQRLGFDLMLAGHTHGGQVRLPWIGPIIAPSRYGVRYASGVFQLGEMAMQVSRGVSGADPLRLNCPPELCQLTLRSGIPETEQFE